MSRESSLRIALAQVNPTVGDIDGNAALITEYVDRAGRDGADLIVFPEMVLTGYPIEDLALRPSFQQASRLACEKLARDLAERGWSDIPVIVGYLDATSDHRRVGRPRGEARNAAAVLQHGTIAYRYFKHHLPNYGVFDEYRYFVPGESPLVFTVGDRAVSVAICEDLWQDGGPALEAATSSDLLVVLNGSPYEKTKHDTRLELCQQRAQETSSTLVYVNLVGGQDELVFDGDSMVVDASGSIVARSPKFVDDLLIVDLPATTEASRGQLVRSPQVDAGNIAADLSMHEEVYRALMVGLRDYVNKNGFSTVIMGLSGGIDSALVAAIACDALGADRVMGVALPSQYSSDHSREDAADLAQRTGLRFREVPIESLVDGFRQQLHLSGLAEENVQARVRGVILMAISNAEGPLVLATGNKSELAVGYSTIYGDAVGGFAPIKDVPKSLVWDLARWRNAYARREGHIEPIPERSISKPPSAELRPDQVDTDSLPDYAELDTILDAYVEHDKGAAELIASGFDHELVDRIVRMIDAAEYKRRQYPPGTKINFRAFGRDRRLPITNRWRETPPDMSEDD